MIRTRRAILAGVAAVLLVATGTGPSVATNYSGVTGGSGCAGAINKPDNLAHSWYNSALSGKTDNAMDWLSTYVTSYTAMSLVKGGSSANADTIVRDDYYLTACGQDWKTASSNGGIIGWSTCDTLNSAGECEQGTLRLSQYWLDEKTTNMPIRALVLHEMGHQFGLLHRNENNEIMSSINGLLEDINYYGPHDKSHLEDN